MDRNILIISPHSAPDNVALRKESVDRNRELLHPSCTAKMSLSARRAWIEITSDVSDRVPLAVALRKESVDRNVLQSRLHYSDFSSLSARRAWIEMDWASVITAMTSVALRKESVDRNDKFHVAVH